MVESLILSRIETDLRLKVGSLYPAITAAADGESTSNVYLRTEYVAALEKELMPYLGVKEDKQPHNQVKTNLAEEWLKLFGKQQDNTSEDANE